MTQTHFIDMNEGYVMHGVGLTLGFLLHGAFHEIGLALAAYLIKDLTSDFFSFFFTATLLL